jgi:hypothetical protein
LIDVGLAKHVAARSAIDNISGISTTENVVLAITTLDVIVVYA